MRPPTAESASCLCFRAYMIRVHASSYLRPSRASLGRSSIWCTRPDCCTARGACLCRRTLSSRTSGLYPTASLSLLPPHRYAWILTWLTEDMLRNPDASLNTTIIYGAEGVLSITETVDTATREYQDYVDLWATRSSLAACRDPADPKFCDADGDPNTLPGYSAMQADSVLVYATAMHSIYRVSPSDPTALHDALINAGSSEAKTRGISGPIFLDPATGDRRGRLTIKNFQISRSAASRRLQLMDGTANSAARVEPVWWRWTRRLFVPLESTVADFVSVGTYNSEGEHGEPSCRPATHPCPHP